LSTIEIIVLVVKLIATAIGAILLAALFSMDLKRRMRDSYASMKTEHYQKISSNPDKRFADESIHEKLLATGIKFRMGDSFSPFDYLCLRLALSFGGAILTLLLPFFINLANGEELSFNHVYLVIPAFIVVFFIVPVWFKQQDGNDNEDMMADIVNLNSMVSLQMKNGVYITKVIYECGELTKNPRLKKALKELSADIETFSSIKDAAESFRKKFNNPYLDDFAKTLEQAQETGQSLDFFEDIQKSISSINEAIAIREEQKADRVASFFQVLLFLGPVIIVFYVLMQMLSGGMGL